MRPLILLGLIVAGPRVLADDLAGFDRSFVDATLRVDYLQGGDADRGIHHPRPPPSPGGLGREPDAPGRPVRGRPDPGRGPRPGTGRLALLAPARLLFRRVPDHRRGRQGGQAGLSRDGPGAVPEGQGQAARSRSARRTGATRPCSRPRSTPTPRRSPASRPSQGVKVIDVHVSGDPHGGSTSRSSPRGTRSTTRRSSGPTSSGSPGRLLLDRAVRLGARIGSTSGGSGSRRKDRGCDEPSRGIWRSHQRRRQLRRPRLRAVPAHRGQQGPPRRRRPRPV